MSAQKWGGRAGGFELVTFILLGGFSRLSYLLGTKQVLFKNMLNVRMLYLFLVDFCYFLFLCKNQGN
jgi:hypothetical protein